MYDIYRYIFIGGLILFAVTLGLTAFLFFYLHIREVIGELTGANKRKAMDKSKEKEKKPKKQTKKPPAENLNVDSQMTSRMSVQDKYNQMEGVDETTSLTPAKTPPPPAAAPPAPPPASVNYGLKKPVMSDPAFVIETDITYVHSDIVV